MRDREEYYEPTETELVLVPVLIEAVFSTLFIACSVLLVVVIASLRAPI